jgi:hypothetical protein
MAIIRNTNLTNVTDLIFYLDAVNPKSYSGSGSVWLDLSPNRNNFTLFNTPTYTQNGTIGTYLTFNGTNQYARSTNAINFNAYSAVTIEIGYRSTVTNATQILYETTGTAVSTATGGITLLMNANSTGTAANAYLSQWQGYGLRLFGFTPSTNTSFNSIVETFVNGSDSTGRQVYVNGTTAQFFTNTAVTVVTSATTSGLSFANTWTYVASRAGTANFFRGDIAYIRAWGKKLATTDLGNNISAIAARQPQSYIDASILTGDPSLKTVLYSFAFATFTPSGATGRTGPTIAQARTAVNQPAWTSTYLNMTHTGVQQWTVAADGIYEITANGARGGIRSGGSDVEGGTTAPGRGARVITRFNLLAGTVLNIIVGQVGVADIYGQGAGGGGGTFVSLGNALESSNLLVAAGGGGGRPWTNNGATYSSALSDGQAGTSGGGTGGGTNGAGGQRTASGTDGGNGGGWLSAGLSVLHSSNQASGPRIQAAASPSGGVSIYTPTHDGGFGGGGGGWGGAGAGGGYSGGASGTSSPNGGPGGGSYVNPLASYSAIISGVGSNYGDGSVIIVYIG